MSTVHQAKIILGWHTNKIPQELYEDGGFVAEFKGKDYDFETCTEGDFFGVVLYVTEWAESIDLNVLTPEPEFIAFLRKECQINSDPKLYLAWDKY